MNIHIDFIGDYTDHNVLLCTRELKTQVRDLQEIGNAVVPWFPLNMSDFNFIGKRVLSEGDGIQAADHPGFRDEEYKARRKQITDLAFQYKVNEPIQPIEYNESEKATWKVCYDALKKLYKTNACKEYNDTIVEFEKDVGFRNDEIP